MLELSRELDLPLKTLGAYAGGKLGCEDFYSDLTSERDFFTDEDAAHPSAAELALYGIG
jgi:hypothetical protein